MKVLFIPFLALLALISCKTKVSVSTIQQFAATESYPNDNYLDTVSNKRALIISAHDDDDCFMAGISINWSKPVGKFNNGRSEPRL